MTAPAVASNDPAAKARAADDDALHADGPAPCPNCGTAPPPLEPPAAYCPACGQATHLHPPTLHEFVHEFAHHYVALEGALWRTLRRLVTDPGGLTLAYLAGQRMRWLGPLKLYLTASFLFFLVAKLSGTLVDLRGLPAEAALPGGMSASASAAASAAVPPARRAAPGRDLQREAEEARRVLACASASAPADCTADERLEGRVLRSAQATAANPGRFKTSFEASLPYLVFALVPAFAGLLQLACRSARLAYGAHFVFALHGHAFAFLVLLATAWLPGGGVVAALAVMSWLVVALRRVHGGGWGRALWRMVAVLLPYGLLLALASAGLAAWVALR